ncbi:GIY-YIG nuclease family protein [Phenylobacterium sp.]|uniref:GIY-YIG nuclease family protein n=1 Tax=Phenylobacterium sp. TaxID=1871053 RepID=UPI0040361BD0
MLIRNYGLHWQRAHVAWGKKGLGNEGHLTGRLAKRATAQPVNFRHQAGIYILHDGFKPLYIGQAGRSENRLFSRLKNHTQNHLAERWDRFSWFGVYPVEDDELDDTIDIGRESFDIDSILNHIEGVLISVTEPPLNRQGARFGETEQYKQIPSTSPLTPAAYDDDDE